MALVCPRVWAAADRGQLVESVGAAPCMRHGGQWQAADLRAATSGQRVYVKTQILSSTAVNAAAAAASSSQAENSQA